MDLGSPEVTTGARVWAWKEVVGVVIKGQPFDETVEYLDLDSKDTNIQR